MEEKNITLLFISMAGKKCDISLTLPAYLTSPGPVVPHVGQCCNLNGLMVCHYTTYNNVVIQACLIPLPSLCHNGLSSFPSIVGVVSIFGGQLSHLHMAHTIGFWTIKIIKNQVAAHPSFPGVPRPLPIGDLRPKTMAL